MEPIIVYGLPLPRLLTQLLAQGIWHTPKFDVLKRAIPFLQGPVGFLDEAGMEFECRGLFDIIDLTQNGPAFPIADACQGWLVIVTGQSDDRGGEKPEKTGQKIAADGS